MREENLKEAGKFEAWSKNHTIKEDFKHSTATVETKESSTPASPTSPEIIFKGDPDQIYLPSGDEEDNTKIEIQTQQNPVIILPDEEDLEPDNRKPTDSASAVTFSNYTVENEDGSVTYVTVASTHTSSNFQESRELHYDEDCDIRVTEITNNIVTTISNETSNRTVYPAT